MTLTDISRLLKFAKVPCSKTVDCFYPNPSIEVFVPMTHYLIVKEVVKRLDVLPGSDLRISPLTSRDVKPNQHVYVKVKGVTTGHTDVNDGSDWREKLRRRRESARMRNCDVVVECASVVVS